jgi:hypothetical protein
MAQVSFISLAVELSFPDVKPLTCLGLDVTLKGAKLGDVVRLTEPWSRPAGVSFFAYIPAADTVMVYAKNKTGDQTISVPSATYGLTVQTP